MSSSFMHSHVLKNKCSERGLFTLGTNQDLITRLLESTSPKCGSSSNGCRCKRYVASDHSPTHAQCTFCAHSAQSHRAPLSPLSNQPAFKFASDTNLRSSALPLNCNDIPYKSTQSLNIEITSCHPTNPPQKENNAPSANKYHPRNNPTYKGHPSHPKTKTLPPNPPVKRLLSLPLGMLQSETSLLRETSQDTEDAMDTTEYKETELRTLRRKSTNSQHRRDTFVAFGSQLKGLHHVIKGHLTLIDRQMPRVEKYIGSLQQTEIASVNKAKEKALATEKQLLHEIIDNVSAMNTFLNDTILIENGFNALYTEKERENQKRARYKWAKNITAYETKPRPTSKTDSFIDLVFKGALYLRTFKEWLANVQRICQKNKIHIVETSGATAKNVERSFYKAFFVYNGQFNQMTDMLRCSLVFDNFDDLYRCFDVIERTTRDHNGGILRCKDRFEPASMPFGYRDLLINIYCPESEMVCEIQLHHRIFYQHKDISHSVYTKARLFDTSDGNLAYKYADQYNRKQIGNRRYQNMVHKDTLEAVQWLKEWKLERYKDALMNRGWCDVKYWKKITKAQLMNDMKFLEGEAVKFMEEAKEIKSRKTSWN